MREPSWTTWCFPWGPVEEDLVMTFPHLDNATVRGVSQDTDHLGLTSDRDIQALTAGISPLSWVPRWAGEPPTPG